MVYTVIAKLKDKSIVYAMTRCRKMAQAYRTESMQHGATFAYITTN